MHEMVTRKEIEVFPDVMTNQTSEGPIMVLRGLCYRTSMQPPPLFSREEKKVLNSIAMLFQGNLTLETRYYPNLYQQYAQAGLYEKIPWVGLPKGIRPHISWKAWAKKVFRLLWQ
jgi:hypothetical protein